MQQPQHSRASYRTSRTFVEETAEIQRRINSFVSPSFNHFPFLWRLHTFMLFPPFSVKTVIQVIYLAFRYRLLKQKFVKYVHMFRIWVFRSLLPTMKIQRANCRVHRAGQLATNSFAYHADFHVLSRWKANFTTITTYLRSWSLPEKLPIVQPFRKFPAILRNPKVHHRVHNSPALVQPIPSHPHTDSQKWRFCIFFLFALWGYWHCGHSWPIVPASVKMIVEKQMECRLAGETEVLGRKPAPAPLLSHMTRPGFEPWPPRWEAGD
jgi:hypothetical protein